MSKKHKDAFYKCSICERRTPRVDIHHKKPRMAGGKDDKLNLMALCASCHDAVHAIAYKLKKMKLSQIEDIARSLFPKSTSKRRKLFEYAALVFRSMQERELTESDEILVPVLLNRGEYARVKTLASTYKNQEGRKLSIQATLRGIIAERLRREFPPENDVVNVTTKILASEAAVHIPANRKR